jgi:hypothetical protein
MIERKEEEIVPRRVSGTAQCTRQNMKMVLTSAWHKMERKLHALVALPRVQNIQQGAG